MKQRNCLISVIVLMAAATFIFMACGGGGGGGGGNNPRPTITAPPAGTLATISQANGEGVTGAAMFGQQINDVTGLSDVIAPMSASGSNGQTSSKLFKVMMDSIKAELMPGDGYQASGSLSDSGECDFGGSGNISITWTGPDAPVSSCSAVSDLTATMEFNSCGVEPGVSMGGTITMTISGNLCQPTGMSLNFTNLSLNEGQVSLAAGSLQMSVTGITWSGNLTTGGFMTHAQIVINGDVTGTMDGSSYAVVFDTYTQDISTPDDINYTIDISGGLYAGCLDGWATLDTVTPIQVRDTANCPHAGELMISGQGSLNIVFNADGSVTMGGTDYPTCDDLNPSGCPL